MKGMKLKLLALQLHASSSTLDEDPFQGHGDHSAFAPSWVAVNIRNIYIYIYIYIYIFNTKLIGDVKFIRK